MKNVATGISSILLMSTVSFAQSDIKFERKDGLNWIMTDSVSPVFNMKPRVPVSKQACANVLKFTADNDLIKSCKAGEELVCTDKIKAHLAKKARKHAFGRAFDGTPGSIEGGSSVDWKIDAVSEIPLDPDKLEDYAAQLGIDPKDSVVANIDGTSLELIQSDQLRPMFTPYEAVEQGGSTWFFTQNIPLVPAEDESQIYARSFPGGNGFVRLSSKILNCELQSIPSEFVSLPFNYRVNGLKPVSATQGDEVFTASQRIASDQMPTGSSELEKALMYGFHLASNIKGETIQKLGMNTIIGKVFDTTGGTVKVKPYATAEEMTEALRVVASYTQEGGYIKLTPEQGE